MPPSLNDRLQSLLGTAFRLDRELTGGGMSRVFVAHEPALKREVVVKVLPPDLVTRESVARFEREVAVTAQLQHPHILPIITTGGADDIYYYVAPYIHGESLRARLAKDGKIPFDECIRLVSELLGAVGFAHARGIIHRDIKPGNILLAEGHAILADFGIARALAGPDDGRLTMTGGAMGTPSYMAPEHPRDEQADLYAVAVVAHEMLTGALPKGRGDIPRTTSEIATAVPRAEASRAKGVAAVLARAMSIDSAKRFRTAREFRDAFEGAGARAGTRRATGALIVTAAALGAIAIWQATRPPKLAPAPSPAGTLLAVFPPNRVGSDSIAAGADELAQRLSAAIEGWSDVHVLAPARVREALGVKATLLGSDVNAAARRLGVDRAVVGEIGRRGDTVLFTASLKLVGDGSSFRTLVASFVPGTPSETRELRRLASALFRDGSELPWPAAGDSRQASLAAWTTYDSARTRLRVWALDDAERMLRVAVSTEPTLAQAHLALASVLRWKRDSRTPASDAEKTASRNAVDLSAALSVHDRHLAKGYSFLVSADVDSACLEFTRASVARASFESLFAFGECRLGDDRVVPSTRSPSGYAFRTGRWGAAAAYERALRVAGRLKPAFPYGRLQRALAFEPNNVRVGRSMDGRVFAAQVEVVSDSVGHWPQDVAANRGAAPAAPTSSSAALQRSRARLRPIFVDWVESSPHSWEAHDGLAKLLEADGTLDVGATDSLSALASIVRARALATGAESADLIRTHVRILLKTGQFGATRLLVDSALARWPAPDDYVAERLVGPAALVGRSDRAAALLQQLSATPSRALRDGSGRPIDLPPALLKERARFYARAATGVCDAEVRAAPARLVDLIDAFYGSREKSGAVVHDVLVEPILLALPCVGLEAANRLDARRSYRVAAAQALSRRDTAAARHGLHRIAVGRDSQPAVFMSMDAVFEDAWLTLVLGDTAAAERHLKRALNGMPAMYQALVNRESISATVPRAMRLFGDLVAARGDSVTARNWRTAAATLAR